MSSSRPPLPPSQPAVAELPSERPTLGSGAAVIGLAQGAMAVLGALASIIIARLLGPADVGAFNVILATFLLAGALSTLGIPVGLIYYVSRRMHHPGDAIPQALVAAVPLGLIAGASVLGLAALTSESIFRGIPFGILAVAMAFLPSSVALTSLVSISLACDRPKAYAAASVVAMALYLILAAALTPVLGLLGAVFAATAPYAIAALGLWAWLQRSVAEPSHDWLRDARRKLLRAGIFGVKPYASSVLTHLNQRVDVFVLNAVAAQATVGHYTIAIAVTSVGLLIPTALSSVVLPRVAALEGGGWEQAMVITKSSRHALLIGLATTGILAVGVLLIPLVYGPAFSPAIVLGLILAPGVAALGLAMVLAEMTTGKGKPEYSLYTALLVTPPTIAGYILLVPAFEAVGAALASTASYTATLVVAALFFRRATGLSSWSEMLPRREEASDYVALAQRLWQAGRPRLRWLR